MPPEDFSPYFKKLLALYDEKRKRFRWGLTLLLLGAIAFFFLVFFPYLTLLGNRADCLAKQAQCTQLETSMLDNRFNEFTTSWGKIPVTTSEVVMLFPLILAVGFLIVSSQLVMLMRLRRAIQNQATAESSKFDEVLMAPIMLDPKGEWGDLLAGAGVLLVPIFMDLFSINLIYVRFQDLRNALPYIQSPFHYNLLYLASTGLLLIALGRVGFEFFRFARQSR